MRLNTSTRIRAELTKTEPTALAAGVWFTDNTGPEASAYGSQKSVFSSAQIKAGFTLVEVLVVLLIFMILTAIALPNVRDVIKDHKSLRGGRGLAAYIDLARSRAIAENRQVGIRIERLSDNVFGRATSVRVRQLTGVPPYTGDAGNAEATLVDNFLPAGVDGATFVNFDSQLLTLTAQMILDGSLDNPLTLNDAYPLDLPVRPGDLIEFPGGKAVPITQILAITPVLPATVPDIRLDFNLLEALDETFPTFPTFRFPSGNRPFAAGRTFKYRIHRRPVVSSTASFEFPRGLAIDLNLSGFGMGGNQFAPSTNPAAVAGPVDIVFGSDGKVVYVVNSAGAIVQPWGQILLCLGNTDGVRPDSLFAQDKGGVSNLLDPDSSWLVINPSTGRASMSPFSPVANTTIPPGVITDPFDASVSQALREARFLANLSDTVDLN